LAKDNLLSINKLRLSN